MSGTTLLWPWPAAPGTRTKTGHRSLIISILRWSLRTFSYFYIYYWKLSSEQENKAIQNSSSNHPQLLHCETNLNHGAWLRPCQLLSTLLPLFPALHSSSCGAQTRGKCQTPGSGYFWTSRSKIISSEVVYLYSCPVPTLPILNSQLYSF